MSLRLPLFQPFHMVSIATLKIKWQNGDDGPYLVHYRELFFLLSFLSLLRFASLALAFILSPLPPFSSFSIDGRTVRDSSGERDRGARFLLLTFCTPIFVLHANLRPDKARFHGELCRLVMEDSSFSNATRLSSTPTYCRLLPLLSSCST